MPHCAPSPSSCSKRGVSSRRRDEQDVADAGQHQRRQRIVDHRLVVDRQQLLRHDLRDRIEPRAGAAGEDDSLARHGVRRPRALSRSCARSTCWYSPLVTPSTQRLIVEIPLRPSCASPVSKVSARRPAEFALGSCAHRSRSGGRGPGGPSTKVISAAIVASPRPQLVEHVADRVHDLEVRHLVRRRRRCRSRPAGRARAPRESPRSGRRRRASRARCCRRRRPAAACPRAR